MSDHPKWTTPLQGPSAARHAPQLTKSAEESAEPDAAVPADASEPTEATQLRKRLAETEQTVARLQAELDHQQQKDVRQPVVEATSHLVTGTEAWQLAQLHQEQVRMQLALEEVQARLAECTAQRDRGQTDVARLRDEQHQLRTLLGQQEALIASLEREKHQLQSHLVK